MSVVTSAATGGGASSPCQQTRAQAAPCAALATGSPKQRHAVGSELPVIRYQGHTLGLRLGEQQAVERVAVMERQCQQHGAMRGGDGKQPKAIRFTLAGKDVGVGRGQLQLSQGELDGHFPEAQTS